jgi:hypothetical protein
MRELVEIMAKALVDNPDQLEVSEIAGSETLVIELKGGHRQDNWQERAQCAGHEDPFKRCRWQAEEACGS